MVASGYYDIEDPKCWGDWSPGLAPDERPGYYDVTDCLGINREDARLLKLRMDSDPELATVLMRLLRDWNRDVQGS
jgi:hypothetical protein